MYNNYCVSDISVQKAIGFFSFISLSFCLGDLFITKDDIENPEIWQSQAWNTTMQQQHRKIMLCMSDYIVPGHGAMFKVEKQMKKLFDCKGRTNF